MDDTLEIKEELNNIAMLARVEEKLQDIERVLVEHGHASDECSAKIAEILGVSEKLPDTEEAPPELFPGTRSSVEALSVRPEPLPSEVDK